MFLLGLVLCGNFVWCSSKKEINFNNSSDSWGISFYGGKKLGKGSFELSESGNLIKCIKISCYDKGTTGQAISRKKISVLPGEKLKLDFEVKHSQGGGSFAQLRFFNKDGRLCAQYVIHFKADEKWRRLSAMSCKVYLFRATPDGKLDTTRYKYFDFNNPAIPKIFVVPEGAAFVKVYLFHSGIGFTAYRDVKLEIISEKRVFSPGEEGKKEEKTSNKSIKNRAFEEEAKRLLMDKEKIGFKKDIGEYGGKKLNLEIVDVELPVEYSVSEEKFPERAVNIRVKGPNLTRNGKPVFLIGAESSPIVFPWWYKLMNFDFIHLGDVYVMATLRYKITGDTFKIWFEPYKWMETEIKELLRNGIAVYVQPIEGNGIARGKGVFTSELRKYGAITNTCHFYGFRPDNPIGMRLKKNFWKSILSITRRYPIFMYELYNEVRYTDYSPANISLFREAMRDKYKTIDKANKVWGTSFETFTEVIPPIKGGSYSCSEIEIQPQNFSRMLWRDWGVFIEHQFGKHLFEHYNYVKKYDPNAYLTIQSFFDMPMGYVSLGGCYPEEFLKAEDIFGMELGGSYFDEFEGQENIDEIKYMLKFSFIRKCISCISSTKPVMGEECVVSKNYKFVDPDKDVIIKLHGKWRFHTDNEDKGFDLGYHKIDFDDSRWKEIEVPGMWGRQGFPECITGWYRKHFNVSNSLKGKKIFLNGKELADISEIYLNGRLIKETKYWNEAFSVDISDDIKYGSENVIAIKITCRYKNNGFYWGGIRNFISINNVPFFITPVLTPGEMRSFLWEQVIDGFSGIILSYNYSSLFGRLCMYRPDRYFYATVRAIPKIKSEINSLANIILPRPRIKSKIAMLFPFETGRTTVYKKRGNKAPLLADIMDFYCGCIFNQLDTDVLSNSLALKNKLQNYRMFILTGCPRVKPGTPKLLEEFVRKGGVLVVNYDSLKVDDDFNTPIGIPSFLGIKDIIPIKNPQQVIFNDIPIQGKTEQSKFSLSYGCIIEPMKGASVIGFYSTGKPAATEFKYGRGKVYYIGCELGLKDTEKLIGYIANKNGIKPALKVYSYRKPAEFVEARLLGRSSKFVWYIFNWGGGTKDIRVAQESIPEGKWNIRDVVTYNTFMKNVSASQIRKGIEIKLKSHEPVILLLEKAGEPSIKFIKIPEAQQRFLKMWRPSPEGEIKVLLCSRYEIMSKRRMLTGVNILEHSGFEFQLGMSPIANEMKVFNNVMRNVKLSDFDIVVSLGNKYARPKVKESAKTLRQYVLQGGGVLLAANHYVGPHGWLTNTRISPLAEVFGVSYTNKNIVDSKEYDDFPEYPRFSDISPHEITNGVKSFQSSGMSALRIIDKKNVQVLIRAGSTSNMPGAPVMVAIEMGKGRVVIMGDAKWMRPSFLAKGDNLQLFLNIFNWLAKRPIKVYNKRKLERVADYRF